MTPAHTADHLAHLVTARGVAGAERELTEFAQSAAAAGVSTTLVRLMLDRGAPAVVRERAFALAAIALRRPAPACRAAA